MAVNLIIAPEAENDVLEAYSWYEQQRAGLGAEFLNCVDARIQGLKRHPEMYRSVYKNYRRGLVRRFPFAVFYEYAGDSVMVYAVFHTSADPNKWRLRLR